MHYYIIILQNTNKRQVCFASSRVFIYFYIYIAVFYKCLENYFWEKSLWVQKHNNARLMPFHISVFFLYFTAFRSSLPPWGFSWLLAGWHFPAQQALAVTGRSAGFLLLFTCCLLLQERSLIHTNKTRENDLATHILNPLPLF